MKLWLRRTLQRPVILFGIVQQSLLVSMIPEGNQYSAAKNAQLFAEYEKKISFASTALLCFLSGAQKTSNKTFFNSVMTLTQCSVELPNVKVSDTTKMIVAMKPST